MQKVKNKTFLKRQAKIIIFSFNELCRERKKIAFFHCHE